MIAVYISCGSVTQSRSNSQYLSTTDYSVVYCVYLKCLEHIAKKDVNPIQPSTNLIMRIKVHVTEKKYSINLKKKTTPFNHFTWKTYLKILLFSCLLIG